MTRQIRSRSRRGKLARRCSLGIFVAACVAVGALVAARILPQYYSTAATGAAKPGDNLKWLVRYQNNAGENGPVNRKDMITSSGAHVPGRCSSRPTRMRRARSRPSTRPAVATATVDTPLPRNALPGVSG